MHSNFSSAVIENEPLVNSKAESTKARLIINKTHVNKIEILSPYVNNLLFSYLVG